MKNNKGVTLISLTVLIVILFMISAISYKISMDTYYSVKTSSISSELKVIQSKVDSINENDNIDFNELTNLTTLEGTDEETYNKFKNIITNTNVSNIDTEKSWNTTLDSNISNYYYFTPEDLESKLGLKDMSLTVIINFDTRNIISKNAMFQDGRRYYRQYDIVGGIQLIN